MNSYHRLNCAATPFELGARIVRIEAGDWLNESRAGVIAALWQAALLPHVRK